MEQIRKYFSGWGAARVVRLILSILLAIGYISAKETIYLFGALVLGLQAVFNISCPGGSCQTASSNKGKQAMKFKKYEPEK
ncbi:MAG TPA: hypothetical protein VK152_10995 [Paludibacter sp.]|nr:hypothetical protein [Paludibacter sp.]